MAIAAGCWSSAAFAAAVPLPRARPAEAPQPAAAAETKPAEKAADAPAAPLQPSACRLALTDAIAIAPTLPPISGPGSCGGEDMVRLEAVVMPDRSRVPLKPAATLRCTMATAVAQWVREDVAAIAAGLGTNVAELDNYDSYNCRGRNNVLGAKMSEHGRANAIDLRGIKLANGKSIALTERETPREQREKVLESVCGRFTTVLGPGSDGYHEDHIHLDLAERRSGYRICQWAVLDPMPAIAPLLPAARPDDAPPRESEEEKARRLKEEAPQASAPPVAAVPAPPAGKGQTSAARVSPEPPKSQPTKPEPSRSGPPKGELAKAAQDKPEPARAAAAPPKAAESPPPAKPAQASRNAEADAPKPKRTKRARREPSLIESLFQPEPAPRRRKSAGRADAFR